jgi:hypothetical protein
MFPGSAAITAGISLRPVTGWLTRGTCVDPEPIPLEFARSSAECADAQ